MGFFNLFKSETSGGSNEPDIWNHPQDHNSIDAILNDKESVHIIFKHSYRCITSISILNRLKPQLELFSRNATLHFIDVVKDRSLSQYIAQKTGIIHDSPQCIILHKGQVFWHESHGGIVPDIVFECLSELSNSN